MSKGKLNKPAYPNLPDNLSKKALEDIIYYVVQTCEVDVENTEWLNADKNLEDKLKNVDDNLKANINDLEVSLKDINKRLGDNQGNLSDTLKSIRTEIDTLKNRKPLDLIIKTDKGIVIDLGLQHNQIPNLLQILSCKLNVYLVGPAGAGKTHAANQCAKALEVPFHFTGAVASEYKLTGFMDAQGRIVSTEFRKAYENGGLFLFDEIDASYPQAVLAFNAALANDYMDFPDKRVPRHENFYCIAAANTYGQGADRQYIGRNQLDAASLDRFVFLEWNYDENLERSLAGNEEWTTFVQKARKSVEKNKIRHVISPRASIFGAKLLASGMNREMVEKTILWKGIDEATIQKIELSIYPIVQVKAEDDGIFRSSLPLNSTVKKDSIIGKFGIYNSYLNRIMNEIPIKAPISGIVKSICTDEKVKSGTIIIEILDK